MTSKSASVFHEHYLQSIIALFLTNPDLYKDHLRHRNRQDYFFEEFRKFAAKYYHFSGGDENIYFGNTRKQAPGEANICGGAGKRSGASSRYFKDRYHSVEKNRENQIDDFARRYGIASFEPGEDTRLFLGVTEIWNKLDRALEIVAASKWADVRERSYDDATGVTPFPKKLDKMLVPLDMRTIVMQQWRIQLTRQVVKSTSVGFTDIEQEEREFLAAKTASPPLNAEVVGNMNPIVFVVPEGLDEEEW